MTRLAFVIVAALAVSAHAQPSASVALLPLDADQRLEIYGQPVATEVASALVAGGVDVVVVGPKMAVPDRARLVLDGKIQAGKGDAVGLSVRLRDPTTGTVLDTLDVTAKELTSIDRAAKDLSALVLPAVKKQLAALSAKHDAPRIGARSSEPAPATAVAPPIVLVAVGATPELGPLRDALAASAARLVAHHHRTATATELAHLAREVAPKAAAGANAELAIAFEVLAYHADAGAVPMARARVRVRIADRNQIAFDRVVVTDTVVGDRGLSASALEARVADSVLDIVEPHLRRAAPTWR